MNLTHLFIQFFGFGIVVEVGTACDVTAPHSNHLPLCCCLDAISGVLCSVKDNQTIND